MKFNQMQNLNIKIKYIPGVTRYFTRTEDILNFGFSHPKVKPGMLQLIKLLKPYVKVFDYYNSIEQIYNRIAYDQRNHNVGTMSEYGRIAGLMSAAIEEHFVQDHNLVLDLTV